MTDMETNCLDDGARCIWQPRGRIDHLSATEWSQRFNDAFDALPEGNRGLVLDLREVDFLSSAGLRELMRLSRRCREKGIGLAVCELQDTVREVFEISRFNLVIPMYSRLEEAVQAVLPAGGAAC